MPNHRVVGKPRWSHSVPDGWLVPWLAPWLEDVAARNVSQGIGDYGLARAAVPCVRQVVCAPTMEHARQTLAQRGHQGGKWGSANYLSEKAPKLPCIGVLIVASSSLSTFPPTGRPKTRPYLLQLHTHSNFSCCDSMCEWMVASTCLSRRDRPRSADRTFHAQLMTATQQMAKDVPRPVTSIISAMKPHECSFGLACTSRIDDIHFHRRRVSQLNATAGHYGLPRRSNSGDLRYFRLIADSIAWDLSARGVDVMEALRAIQSPEYWEAEKAYLARQGCLEQQQQHEIEQSRGFAHHERSRTASKSRRFFTQGHPKDENCRSRYTSRGKKSKKRNAPEISRNGTQRVHSSEITSTKIQRRRGQRIWGRGTASSQAPASSRTRSRLNLRSQSLETIISAAGSHFLGSGFFSTG